jgi:DNA repair protein RadD
MTFILRPYQREAIDALYSYWGDEGGNPLVVLPTGTGKSGVAGTLKRELFNDYRDMRILNVTHVAELVGQNYAELVGMWDWAPAGVYSAGLGRRELASQILFAGIQSIHSKIDYLGSVDLLMVDEAHLIPRNADTMYGRFITGLRERNPDMRLVGLTATPYRTDSGRLDEGDDKMFDSVCYEYSIRTAIDDGYLTPLVGKETATRLDTRGVGRRGGDWVPSQLQAAVDKSDLNRAIIDEVVEYGHNRRSWLGFAAGVEHAHHLAEEIRSRGFSAGVVDGSTPPGERKRLIAEFKSYQLRALVNCGVLTTGFNHPGVDLIFAARPTESTGLYVQIAGRGTRNVYAPGMPLDTREQRIAAIAGGPKPNCLFLDFGGLVRRHGPIDMVQPRKPGKGGGDAPVKSCPECHSIVHASAMECPDCGFTWERQLSEKITKAAAVLPIMSKGAASWKEVTRRSFARHDKLGSPSSVRVEYWCGMNPFKEWVPFENEKLRWKAEKWWKEHHGLDPCPATVSEALKRTEELRSVAEIRIEPSGRFFNISGRRFGGDAEDEVNENGPAPSVWGRKAHFNSGVNAF